MSNKSVSTIAFSTRYSLIQQQQQQYPTRWQEVSGDIASWQSDQHTTLYHEQKHHIHYSWNLLFDAASTNWHYCHVHQMINATDSHDATDVDDCESICCTTGSTVVQGHRFCRPDSYHQYQKQCYEDHSDSATGNIKRCRRSWTVILGMRIHL